jgi:hypothetical protein
VLAYAELSETVEFDGDGDIARVDIFIQTPQG